MKHKIRNIVGLFALTHGDQSSLTGMRRQFIKVIVLNHGERELLRPNSIIIITLTVSNTYCSKFKDLLFMFYFVTQESVQAKGKFKKKSELSHFLLFFWKTQVRYPAGAKPWPKIKFELNWVEKKLLHLK